MTWWKQAVVFVALVAAVLVTYRRPIVHVHVHVAGATQPQQVAPVLSPAPQIASDKLVGCGSMFTSGRDPAPATNLDWRAHIASGKPFVVTLDRASEIDDARMIPDDPMGTLLGGERYDVRYRDGSFTTTGFNESTGGVGTWTYPATRSLTNELSLWGACFVFDRLTGEVFHPQHGLVGHLAGAR